MNYVADVFKKIEEFHRKQVVKEEMAFLKNRLSTEEYNWLYEFFRNEIREKLDNKEFHYVDTEQERTYNYVLEHPRSPLAKKMFVDDVPMLIDFLQEGSFHRTHQNSEFAKRVLTKLGFNLTTKTWNQKNDFKMNCLL